MEIRPETPADLDTIHRLTKTAFDPMPYSDGNEADCVDALRADGDLTLSLVAVEDGEIVGHVAFSPVTLANGDGDWFGLGPVSVWPERQKQGIGGALIRFGLDDLRRRGAAGCVLIGDPGYYGRFGFAGDGRVTYRDLDTVYVQWLAFGEARPSGEITYSPGLE